jgi:hypothetical protein
LYPFKVLPPLILNLLKHRELLLLKAYRRSKRTCSKGSIYVSRVAFPFVIKTYTTSQAAEKVIDRTKKLLRLGVRVPHLMQYRCNHFVMTNENTEDVHIYINSPDDGLFYLLMQNIAVVKKAIPMTGSNYVDKYSQGLLEFQNYLCQDKRIKKNPYLITDILYDFLCLRILSIGDIAFHNCLIQKNCPGLSYIMLDFESNSQADSSFLALLRWLSFKQVSLSKLIFAKFVVTYAFGGTEIAKANDDATTNDALLISDIPIDLKRCFANSYFDIFVNAFMVCTRYFYRKAIQKISLSVHLRLLTQVIAENNWH